MTWPTKTDFVDGDVLTASQVNNIGTNLNLFNPTSATAGQVPIADGAGSVAFGNVAAGGIYLLASGTWTGATSYTISSIPQTYKNLRLYMNTFNAGNFDYYFNPNGTSANQTFFTLYMSADGTPYYVNQTSCYTYSVYQPYELDVTIWDYTVANQGKRMELNAKTAASPYRIQTWAWGHNYGAAVTSLQVNVGSASKSANYYLYGIK